ncbi:hypothetical protein L1049_025542 [Liquidambar formosana]|uniref:NAB domain-containing protein n=1 Tax=Liquidambar formosana TaxID=63359 RepID=A0AAP0R6G2_LIQFO
MGDKVTDTLKIIDEDGDSFAKRAEMYYKKRPELINFVEESYRAYRALAERYDHISKELQNANRTIASIFPEQVQFAMDDEDDENFPEKINPSHESDKPPKDLPDIPKPTIPKVPKIPKKDFKAAPMFISKKGPLKRTASSARTVVSSGLSKTEAMEEIDELQKGILVLQTEKEFVKSSYESGLSKYWEIERRITEMQGKVCSLQDEYSIGRVIEDDEAQKLMVAAALKSCQQTLIRLQETQRRSAEEARIEYQRIKEAHEKLETLKDKLLQAKKGSARAHRRTGVS